MFVRQNQQQFRNSNADVQIFYGDANAAVNATRYRKSWNKPPGVSHVYMMLIGPGGNGNSTPINSGGGSGAVTVWYGAAQNVPNSLQVIPGGGITSGDTYVYDAASGTVLLSALVGDVPTGGAATAANAFAASGFYQSVAGQDGSGTSISASSTTFLAGGGAAAQSQLSNYGYASKAASGNANGFFQLMPIIVGTSGMGSGRGGIGCGGGLQNAIGGQGMVLIASW